MISGIKFARLPACDQDRALRFRTEQMGLVVVTDQPFDETQRWIELRIPKSEGRIAYFGEVDHSFRPKAIIGFGSSRSRGSVHVDHPFRSTAITDLSWSPPDRLVS